MDDTQTNYSLDTTDWSKEDYHKKKELVFELCERLGFWNVSSTAVAKKLHVKQPQISKWKKQWIRDNGIPQMETVKKELNVASMSALQELSRICHTNNDAKIKVMAARTLLYGIDQYTNFLERFGYKQMTMIPISVNTGDEVNINLIKIAQEAAESALIDVKAKTKGDSNEQNRTTESDTDNRA